MTLRFMLAATCVLASACASHPAAPPNSARAAEDAVLTPPMGWNSWNKFGCHIDEETIRSQARAMVSSGMAAAGYRYVVLDDCWQGQRDGDGNLQADAVRFPSGIKSLASYVHSLGLEFGIYSDAGDRSCEKKPGSRGHEFQDARQFAAWGVDYLKYDWCNTDGLEAPTAYKTIADALRASGRPIVLSICNWGQDHPWEWAASVGGNLWRTGGDIYDIWQKTPQSAAPRGVLDILDVQVGLEGFAGPRHWNDPDMLEVGNGGMTDEEDRAHFSLWAMLAAPLIAGNDMASMSAATVATLTNREVIAVDQDALGIEGRRAIKEGDTEVWVKPLIGGSQAIALLNRGEEQHTIRVESSSLPLPSDAVVDVQDLWSGRQWRESIGTLAADVAPHAVVMLKLVPAAPAPL